MSLVLPVAHKSLLQNVFRVRERARPLPCAQQQPPAVFAKPALPFSLHLFGTVLGHFFIQLNEKRFRDAFLSKKEKSNKTRRARKIKFAEPRVRAQNSPAMKKIATLFAIATLAVSFYSGCLYRPDVTYTYWKFSPETQIYSAFRTETPLTSAELKELGLTDTLPQNAKTAK